MTSFRSLDEADVKGKRVLVRVDFNVPMESGEVTDATRIERAAPTIREIADKGGKVILEPVAVAAEGVIGRPVAFAADCIGEIAEKAIAAMRPGDILCLENTRFHAGEAKNDPAFVAALARLGDIYVNDAFSAAHRANASTEGLAHKLPACAGRAMQAELEALEKALHAPQRPVAAIVGGAKISTKLDLLGNLLTKVETLIVGGGMANTFLAAQNKAVGRSLCESDLLPTARDILAKAKNAGRDVVLPVDAVVTQKFAAHVPSRVVSVDEIGATDMILDIGPRTVEHVVSLLARTRTLLWNGPLGAFEHEPFDNGTVEVAEAAAELTDAGKLVTIAGGGDTVAALNAAGVSGRFTYTSTAGGAFLEWLEGKTLPGVAALEIDK